MLYQIVIVAMMFTPVSEAFSRTTSPQTILFVTPSLCNSSKTAATAYLGTSPFVRTGRKGKSSKTVLTVVVIERVGLVSSVPAKSVASNTAISRYLQFSLLSVHREGDNHLGRQYRLNLFLFAFMGCFPP